MELDYDNQEESGVNSLTVEQDIERKHLPS